MFASPAPKPMKKERVTLIGSGTRVIETLLTEMQLDRRRRKSTAPPPITLQELRGAIAASPVLSSFNAYEQFELIESLDVLLVESGQPLACRDYGVFFVVAAGAVALRMPTPVQFAAKRFTAAPVVSGGDDVVDWTEDAPPGVAAKWTDAVTAGTTWGDETLLRRVDGAPQKSPGRVSTSPDRHLQRRSRYMDSPSRVIADPWAPHERRGSYVNNNQGELRRRQSTGDERTATPIAGAAAAIPLPLPPASAPAITATTTITPPKKKKLVSPLAKKRGVASLCISTPEISSGPTGGPRTPGSVGARHRCDRRKKSTGRRAAAGEVTALLTGDPVYLFVLPVSGWVRATHRRGLFRKMKVLRRVEHESSLDTSPRFDAFDHAFDSSSRAHERGKGGGVGRSNSLRVTSMEIQAAFASVSPRAPAGGGGVPSRGTGAGGSLPLGALFGNASGATGAPRPPRIRTKTNSGDSLSTIDSGDSRSASQANSNAVTPRAIRTTPHAESPLIGAHATMTTGSGDATSPLRLRRSPFSELRIRATSCDQTSTFFENDELSGGSAGDTTASKLRKPHLAMELPPPAAAPPSSSSSFRTFTSRLPKAVASREDFLKLVKRFSIHHYHRMNFAGTPRSRGSRKASRKSSRKGSPRSRSRLGSQRGTPGGGDSPAATDSLGNSPRRTWQQPAAADVTALDSLGNSPTLNSTGGGDERMTSPLTLGGGQLNLKRSVQRKSTTAPSPSTPIHRGSTASKDNLAFGVPVPLALTIAQLRSIVSIRQARKDLIREGSVWLNGEAFEMGHEASIANIEGELVRQLACLIFAPPPSSSPEAKAAKAAAGGAVGAPGGGGNRPLVPSTPRSFNPETVVKAMNIGSETILLAASRTVTGGDAYLKMEMMFDTAHGYVQGGRHGHRGAAGSGSGGAGGGDGEETPTGHICVMPRRNGTSPITIDIAQVRKVVAVLPLMSASSLSLRSLVIDVLSLCLPPPLSLSLSFLHSLNLRANRCPVVVQIAAGFYVSVDVSMEFAQRSNRQTHGKWLTCLSLAMHRCQHHKCGFSSPRL